MPESDDRSRRPDLMRKFAREPIAIIGLGCRFPGNADSPDAFWRLIEQGRNAITEVPGDRWDVDAFYDADAGRLGKTYTRWGGFLDQIDQFDAGFFGISPREAESMDPQQRLLLEVAWEALEDAGETLTRLAGTNAGVFVGISTHDYGDIHMKDVYTGNSYTNSGNALSIAANRISYAFDLRGPSMAVDTACSSSLVAVHMACRSIWDGECGVALAGGVNCLITPEPTIGFSKANMLSPDGQCHTFDAGANGYVRGEGAGVVLLKPLAQAVADNDPIYAVIRATGVNQDGHTHGLTVPSQEMQEALLRDVYEQADVSPERVLFVEAHGTGTPVGDPIEASAIGNVLGITRSPEQPLRLGSVKTNIGHLEAASGIAGLIKAALLIKHRALPPNLNFDTPNPRIDFERLNLKVQQNLEPWPKNTAATFVGVNSFGFGGTNAHVVLGQAPEPISRQEPAVRRKTYLLPLSARGPEALTALAGSYLDQIAAPDGETYMPLPELSHAAGTRRTHLENRLALTVSSREELIEQLQAFVAGELPPGTATGRTPGRPPPVAFVYSGMGPQWQGMGLQLLNEEPVFRAAIEEVDEHFFQYAGWSLIKELTAEAHSSRMDQTEVAQPANFALQVGLTALWRSWGIVPNAIVGHSAGEVAAAYAAGVLSLADAVLVIYHRSRLQQQVTGQGAMLAVGLSADDALAALNGYQNRVSLAAINSSRAVTLSGDAEAIEDTARSLDARQVFARVMDVNVPYHSHFMDPLKDELLADLACITPQSSTVPLYSTVTGALIEGSEIGAAYWWRNVREPVQFSQAVGAMLSAGFCDFIELSPHPVLGRSVVETQAGHGDKGVVLPSLRRETDEGKTLLTSLGTLYTLGLPVEWTQVNRATERRVELPPYPWQRERHWNESEASSKFRLKKLVHPLLERRLDSPRPTWETHLNAHDLAYLSDHQIQGAVLYPAAAYIEMALAAAQQTEGEGPCEVQEIEFKRALTLPPNELPWLQLVLDSEDRKFSIYSRSRASQQWTLHAGGRLSTDKGRLPASSPKLIDRLIARSVAETSGAASYQALREHGLNYGPRFQGIERVWHGRKEALGRIAFHEDVRAHLPAYRLHPVVLDACFQVMIGAASFGHRTESDKRTYLPVKIDRLAFFKPIAGEGLWAHARVTQRSSGFLIGDITILDDAGAVVAQVEGFRCQAIPQAGKSAADLAGLYYKLDWYAKTLRDSASTRHADYLPSPASLAATLHADADLWARLAAEAHPDVESAIEGFCAAYVLSALRDLGWEPARGDEVELAALAGQLGVGLDRLPLLAVLLDLLTSDGVLQAAGKGWVVAKVSGAVDTEQLMHSLMEQYPQHKAFIGMAGRCCTALPSLLRGETDASIDIDGEVDSPASAFNRQRLAGAVRRALDGLPIDRTLRILEIGPANGDLTALMLPIIPQNRVEYVFSSRSGVSLAPAQQRFAGYPLIEFQTLDIERELDAHAFAPHSFDLIVATEAMSSVGDPGGALANVAKLLSSQGMLLAWEQTHASRVPALVNAVRNAASPDAPISGARSSEAWRALLSEAGFIEAAAVSSAAMLATSQVLLIARGPCLEGAGSRRPAPAIAGRWLIFSDQGGLGTGLAEALGSLDGPAVVVNAGAAYRRLSKARFEVRSGEAEDVNEMLEAIAADAPIAGVLYLWGLDMASPEQSELGRAVSNRAGADVVHLVHGLARLAGTPPRLWLITRGAQNVSDMEALPGILQSPLWGLGRVIMNEHPHLRCTLVDLPDTTAAASDLLLREIRADDMEQEICLRPNARYVPRVTRFAPPAVEQRPPAHRSHRGGKPFTLEVATSGSLDSLVLRERRRRKPGANEVEIEVYAAGLNFRDVMKGMGLYPSEEGDPFWLGDECSGVVTRVGDDVAALAAGDEVVVIAPGCFSSFVTVPAGSVIKKPAHLSFEEAAGLPIVFLTTHYALNHVAGLSSSDKILIHAAAGGVGLAAVQMAQRAGAEIYATAGAAEKHQYLRERGVKHIMDSRSLGFAEETMRLTGGRGVDVVLNSLAGDFIPSSMSLLRPMGRFLELGKIDLYQNTRLGLWPFRSGLSFSAIDMGWLIQHRPELARTLLVELMAMFENKELAPLPVRVFPISEATQAFRFMAQARHIGKIVMSMREAKAVTVAADPAEKQLFRKDATYLLTGGLGGFGLAIARWLADQGARHLVLAGRSGAATPEAEQAVSQLRAARVQVEVVQLDVTDRDKVTALVERIESSMPPLRGVFHAAMVLDDGYLLQLDKSRFENVMQPKVEGAWNLHLATLRRPLDHFVLFSSLSSWAGSIGQANYAAANAFLDALAHYRHGLHLPALSVNWGVITEVGYIARNPEVGRLLGRQGFLGLKPEEATAMLGALLQAKVAEAGAIRVDFDSLRESLGRGPAYRRFANVLQSPAEQTSPSASGAKAGGLLAVLRSKSSDEQLLELEALLRREIANVLGVTASKLDAEQELSSLGLDSLMSVELEMTLERELGADLPLGFFLGDDISLRQLCLRLRDQLSVLAGDSLEGEALPGLAVAGVD